MNTTTVNTTAVSARLLGVLRDGRVWSVDELGERLEAEVEAGVPGLAGTVADSVDALVDAGLAHRVSDELVAASWRGMHGEAAADPDDQGGLRVVEQQISEPGVT